MIHNNNGRIKMPVLTPAERKTFTLTKEEAEAAASACVNGARLTFQSLANRNWVAKIVRQKYRGYGELSKYTHKNQLYDPRYTVEGSDIPDKGFANDYKHYFASIYCLETSARRGW
jgi:hypothetical protein